MSEKVFPPLFVLCLFLTIPSESVPSEPSVVGTWELERVDGVQPADLPPWGYPRVVVDFSPNGRLEARWPGEASEPKASQYEVGEDWLVGWMGLSNDFETPRRLAFPATGWMELTFPEGFVATFRATDGTAKRAGDCAFFTVMGHDYDPEQVALHKRAMFDFQSGAVPPELHGAWRAQMGQADEGAVEIDLTLSEREASFEVRSLDTPRQVLVDATGWAETSGGFLRTPAMACGAVQHYTLSNGVLQLTTSAEPPLRLGKAE